MLDRFSTLTGTGNPAVNLLPVSLAVAVAAGFVVAVRLRRNRPGDYAALAPADLSGERMAG